MALSNLRPRVPFDPYLGQPKKGTPTPTQRQMEMRTAHLGGRGWQEGGLVGLMGRRPGSAPTPRTPGILYETPEERAAFLEERKQKLMETQVGYVPGMGGIYGGSTGMGSNYYDASGNPITKDMGLGS